MIFKQTPEQLAAMRTSLLTHERFVPCCVSCRNLMLQTDARPGHPRTFLRCTRLGKAVAARSVCVYFTRRGARQVEIDRAFELARERMGIDTSYESLGE